MKVELTKGTITELKEGGKYLIGLNNEQITKNDAAKLANALYDIGISNCAVVVFKGDPSTGMQVLELPEEKL